MKALSRTYSRIGPLVLLQRELDPRGEWVFKPKCLWVPVCVWTGCIEGMRMMVGSIVLTVVGLQAACE